MILHLFATASQSSNTSSSLSNNFSVKSDALLLKSNITQSLVKPVFTSLENVFENIFGVFLRVVLSSNPPKSIRPLANNQFIRFDAPVTSLRLSVIIRIDDFL